MQQGKKDKQWHFGMKVHIGATKQGLVHSGAINRSRSRRRARGEFAFRVVKRLWGFTMVRYRGLFKNTTEQR